MVNHTISVISWCSREHTPSPTKMMRPHRRHLSSRNGEKALRRHLLRHACFRSIMRIRVYRRYAMLYPRLVQRGIELYSKGSFSFFGLFFFQNTSSRRRFFWVRAGWSPHAVRYAQASRADIEPRRCLSPTITIVFFARVVSLRSACFS
jgi:hypothetical protein